MMFRYEPGNSPFHRIDPLSKFVWLVSVSVLALRYASAPMQAALFCAVALQGVLLARLSLRSLWRGLRFPLWFVVPYFVLQLVFVPGETELTRVGTFVLTAEALDYAAAIALRLVTLILASLLFVATTDPRDVVLALAQKLRVPYRFAFAISIALRFVPVLEEEAELVRAAQRLRGLGEPAGLKHWLSWRKRFALAVFASAIRRVQKTAEAMEAKHFGAYRDRTYRKTVTVPPAGIVLSAVSGLAAAGLLVWL